MNRRVVQIFSTAILLGSTTGCYTGASDFADQLNPYADNAGTEIGERNTNALGGGGQGKQAEAARNALEVLSSYRRAQAPSPAYPVVRPAEIRLMWIPDHINRLGDLVPAHYYYLKVLREEFAVEDAFDNERVLNSRGPIGYTGGGVTNVAPGAAAAPAGLATPSGDLGTEGSGATPWQYKQSK